MMPSNNAFLPVDLSRKRVVVTAGGSGIGRAIAEGFLACGSSVYVCDVDNQLLHDMLSSNHRATGCVADVSSIIDVDRMFDDVMQKFGGVDVLVNNAGIAGPTAGIVDVEPDELRKTLAIDVEGMFHCARRAVPSMRKAGAGSIINLGSVAGRLSFSMRTPYSAAKWGVVGFTKSLALELGPEKIQVNAILPGHVNSSRFRGVVARKAAAVGIAPAEMEAQMLDAVAMKETVEVADIANMALFLASPFGAAITGQAISVCKGVEMMR
jgi:NAD(P)-dependent dehydrogenase (short-subunit alcohol dehydrogenase family)